MVLITCDFKGDASSYSDFFAELRRLNGENKVLQILEWSWLVASNLSADQICDRLRPYKQQGDRFIVSDITDQKCRQGWLAKSSWEWIRLNREQCEYNFQLSYDRKNDSDDTEKLCDEILLFLKNKCGVGQKGIMRPSQSTLVFYSLKDEKLLLKEFKECFDYKLYYSLACICQTSERNWIDLSPNDELTRSIRERWQNL